MPDVDLPSTLDGTVNLRTRYGAAIVFVYPFTGTPGLANPPDWDKIPGAHGSTPQAEGFRDHYAEITAQGHEVFGLSSQVTAYQNEFSERLALPFALLSDHNFAFADALRLPRFDTGGITYLKRLTMIIHNGVLERVVYPVHPPHTHASLLPAILRAGQKLFNQPD